MANKSNKNKSGNTAKKKKSGVVSDGEKAKTRAEAREIAEETTEAAQNGDEGAGEDGPDEAVAEARAEIEAENSPADYVAPLTPNDQLAVDDLDDDDDEDDDDFPVAPDHVARNILMVASSLPRDEKSTEEMTAKKAAKAVGVKERGVTGFAVRGDDLNGRYVVVTTHDGQKHAATV